MTARVTLGRDMIRAMAPRLNDGAFVFATVETAPADAVATLREGEGLSAIVPAPQDAPLAMGWITLEVHSALDGVGLTAAVAITLAEADMACNVVAGHHHDHIFVPYARRNEAVALLRTRAEAEA